MASKYRSIKDKKNERIDIEQKVHSKEEPRYL